MYKLVLYSKIHFADEIVCNRLMVQEMAHFPQNYQVFKLFSVSQ